MGRYASCVGGEGEGRRMQREHTINDLGDAIDDVLGRSGLDAVAERFRTVQLTKLFKAALVLRSQKSAIRCSCDLGG